MLTDTTDSGDYVIPHIIYSDAYSSEMVAYADLILPDTTYLERHGVLVYSIDLFVKLMLSQTPFGGQSSTRTEMLEGSKVCCVIWEHG